MSQGSHRLVKALAIAEILKRLLRNVQILLQRSRRQDPSYVKLLGS
jgi:hypothetical protein